MSLRRFLQRTLYALTVYTLVVGVMSPALALPVAGLYSHQTSLLSESETARNQAFSRALRAVIVKLTGGDEALAVPGVDAALISASDYVEGVSYATLEVGTAASEQRLITVDFAPALIDSLLARLGVPVWNSNRPSVLVWIALQSSEGERRLMTPESDPGLVAALEAFARGRGLPLIFPVLDVEDRRALPETDLWDLREEAIFLASARYGADSILAGRIQMTPNSELVGLWQFQFQGESQIFDGFDTEVSAYAEAPLRRVATQLASYFSLPSVSGFEQRVRLRVDGIRSLEDYAGLIGYVEDLGVVAGYRLASLEAERLEIELQVQGDSRRLGELIALDRDLLPIDSASENSLLHYRWTR